MEKRVLTVLRSGGEYTPAHVWAMQRQVEQWAPGARFACLSDVEIPGVETIPLKHDWPHWWAKLELFDPELPGGFLYTDLDNVIIGPIGDLFCGRYVTQNAGWNALMFVPDAPERERVYEEFRRDPEKARRQFAFSKKEAEPFGDAGFARQFWKGTAWEREFPGQVVNIVQLITRWPFTAGADARTYPYKQPAPGTRVVLCANKNRRPWKLPLFEHLYREEKT